MMRIMQQHTGKGNPEENKLVTRREKKTSWMRLASAHLFGLVPHTYQREGSCMGFYPCESQQRILIFLFFF